MKFEVEWKEHVFLQLVTLFVFHLVFSMIQTVFYKTKKRELLHRKGPDFLDSPGNKKAVLIYSKMVTDYCFYTCFAVFTVFFYSKKEWFVLQLLVKRQYIFESEIALDFLRKILIYFQMSLYLVRVIRHIRSKSVLPFILNAAKLLGLCIPFIIDRKFLSFAINIEFVAELSNLLGDLYFFCAAMEYNEVKKILKYVLFTVFPVLQIVFPTVILRKWWSVFKSDYTFIVLTILLGTVITLNCKLFTSLVSM